MDGELCEVGTVRLRLEGRAAARHRGAGRSATPARSTSTASTRRASEAPPAAGGPHPNGTRSIDHLVVISPDLDRTSAVLRDAGLDLRRLREGDTPGGSRRQAFFRMGELILEVVQAPPGTKIAPTRPARPASGASPSGGGLERRPRRWASSLGEPRDAVQPGRRIATVATAAGLGPAIAFMTPGPGRERLRLVRRALVEHGRPPIST